MLRSIMAIVVGYLVTAIMVIASQSLALFKPEFAFESATLNVTLGWVVYALASSFVAAIVGGFVASLIASVRKNLAVSGLVILILVFGLGYAYLGAKTERPLISAETIAKMNLQERLTNARQPNWYAFSLPFLGAAGVFLGSRLRR